MRIDIKEILLTPKFKQYEKKEKIFKSHYMRIVINFHLCNWSRLHGRYYLSDLSAAKQNPHYHIYCDCMDLCHLGAMSHPSHSGKN